MKLPKKGIPKKRLPEGLAGIIVRSGRITASNDYFFRVETRNDGLHIFNKEYAKKIFNKPIQGEKVYICYYGAKPKEKYFPFKVCDRENKKTFYEE